MGNPCLKGETGGTRAVEEKEEASEGVVVEPMSQGRDMGHPDSLSAEGAETPEAMNSDSVTDTVTESNDEAGGSDGICN